ncbi:proteasome endopeptidase complex, archaeal, alpha subunit [Candidatus Woesearchaeota archaeon]|jgi:proteasome alpha subunit|nr:proteasome endopeptidase complex, archaeal, alpha subunit [Candidatus Woesearchaeota archaeon]|tara:strand:+ start:100 stop:816 length:717 start_codon:yes stop_codon:yes gene_type:complete
MEAMQHQMMGYDRAITMFSPDGRLLQVEYAKKTVKLGNTAIGMVCKDGVLLVADKRVVDKLVVLNSIEKIFQIDDHLIATASGIISDARVLVERAQLKAQQHKVTYDTSVDVLSVVKDICNLKQVCTQSGGLRPFGVSLLVAGVEDDVPKLFETDPTGIYNQYLATAIGEGEVEMKKILHKQYKDGMSLDDGLKLCVKALKKILDNDFGARRIDASFVSTKTKLMEKVPRDKIRQLLK